MLLRAGSLRLCCCYYVWESKQRDILLANVGNGLAPSPEQNSEFPRLVSLGRSDLPFLVRKLTQLMAKRYPDNESYLYGLSRYVAFAVADVSGWDRRELQAQAKKKDMDVEHYVLWRATSSAVSSTDPRQRASNPH